MAGDRIRLERAFEIYLRLSGLDRVTRKARLEDYCELLALNGDAATADIHLRDYYFVASRDERGLYVERDEFRAILKELRSRPQAS